MCIKGCTGWTVNDVDFTGWLGQNLTFPDLYLLNRWHLLCLKCSNNCDPFVFLLFFCQENKVKKLSYIERYY